MKAALLLALLLPAGTAFAAAPPTTPGTPMADVPGGKNITCSAFLKLGGEAETKVLYFVNGYAAGIADQIAAGTPPAQGGTQQTGQAIASNTAGSITSIPAINGIALDQLQTLCNAEPSKTVLAVIPGGLPISGSGSITSAGGTSGTGGTNGAAAGTATGGVGTSTGGVGTSTPAAGTTTGPSGAVNATTPNNGTLGSTMPGSTGTGTTNGVTTTAPGTATGGGTTTGTTTTGTTTTTAPSPAAPTVPAPAASGATTSAPAVPAPAAPAGQ